MLSYAERFEYGLPIGSSDPYGAALGLRNPSIRIRVPAESTDRVEKLMISRLIGAIFGVVPPRSGSTTASSGQAPNLTPSKHTNSKSFQPVRCSRASLRELALVPLLIGLLAFSACSIDFDAYRLREPDGAATHFAADGGPADGGNGQPDEHDAGDAAEAGRRDASGGDASESDGGYEIDAAEPGDAGESEEGGAGDAGDGGEEARCGNDTVEEGELCDGDCPTSCDDLDPCTDQTLEGSAEQCNARCAVTLTITAPADGDGCCPSGANANNDDDCVPVCGNGATETTEVCDDSNQLNGDNCDPTCSYFNSLSILSGRPGRAGYSDGELNEARLYHPDGIARDGNVLYVVDINGSLVRKIDSGGVVTTVAGRMYDRGQCDRSGADDGIGTEARFCYPTRIAALDNKLWIIELGEEGLRVIDLATSEVSTDNSLSESNIKSLKADGDTLLFFDGALKRWDPTQELSASNPEVLADEVDIETITSDDCIGLAKLGTSYYLGCRSAILKVSSSGTVSLFAGDPSSTGCVDTNDRLASTFRDINDIATDGTDLYAVDSTCYKVRKIYVSVNLVSTYAGSGTSGSEDGTASVAQFAYPTGIVQYGGYGSNDFYVSDWYSSAIRSVTPSVTTWAGSGRNKSIVYGADGASSRYGGSASYRHRAIATDGTYAYFIVDGGGGSASIGRITLENGASESFATSSSWTSSQPGGLPGTLAVLGEYLYLTRDGSIWRVPLADGSSPALYAGTDGDPGSEDGPVNSAKLQARLLAADPASETLYFFDADHTLRRINIGAATPNVLTLAGVEDATEVQDGSFQTAGFADPVAMTFGDQRLYLLDGGRLLREIDLADNQVTTIAGADVDEPRADGLGTAARLINGIAIASDGSNLFIGDASDSLEYGGSGQFGAAIRQVKLSSAHSTTTMVGRDDRFTTISGIGRSAALFEPLYMTYDHLGHRLLIFDSTEGVFLQLQ